MNIYIQNPTYSFKPCMVKSVDSQSFLRYLVTTHNSLICNAKYGEKTGNYLDDAAIRVKNGKSPFIKNVREDVIEAITKHNYFIKGALKVYYVVGITSDDIAAFQSSPFANDLPYKLLISLLKQIYRDTFCYIPDAVNYGTKFKELFKGACPERYVYLDHCVWTVYNNFFCRLEEYDKVDYVLPVSYDGLPIFTDFLSFIRCLENKDGYSDAVSLLNEKYDGYTSDELDIFNFKWSKVKCFDDVTFDGIRKI